jgi:hypothetical protein
MSTAIFLDTLYRVILVQELQREKQTNSKLWIDSCSPIVAEFGITLAEFYSWNPAVGSSCTTLLAGYYVCVGIPGITTTPPPTTTSTNTGPQPEQTGIM